MQSGIVARVLGVLLTAVALGSAGSAQQPGPGLTWSGSSGTGAGSFAFDCAPDAVSATVGEIVTVTVWGDIQAPYWLFLASSASQCTPFPGFTGALVLDPPVVLLASGLLTQITPCLSCPPGLEPLTFAIPPGIPPGIKPALQAVSYGAGQPGLTRAIVVALP